MDPSQLSEFESMCAAVYTQAQPPEVQKAAQERLAVLSSSVDSFPQLQHALDASTSPYARHFASTTMTQLLTNMTSKFTMQQKIDIRNSLLNLLANSGHSMQPFVLQSTIQLLCRVTKVGWNESEQHQNVTDEVQRFLSASPGHCIVGLQILVQLIVELSQALPSRSITQTRKIAIAFRNNSLLKCYQVSLNSLKQLCQSPPAPTDETQTSMIYWSLKLSLQCLNYDFIGSAPDESVDDMSTIQIPTAWRSHIEDQSTVQMYFDFYHRGGTYSSLALECLVVMASVRKSLFLNEPNRLAYFGNILNGICTILQTQRGLEDRNNCHEFCRLLARIKTSLHTPDLVAIDCYASWLDMTTKFCIASFTTWNMSPNSVHYLLGLWARLVLSIPMLKGEKARLEEYAPQIAQTYISSRIESVQVIMSSQGALEDPLANEEMLSEQLEHVPTLCRIQHEKLSNFIMSLFSPRLQKYQEMAQNIAAVPPDTLDVLQSELTWLVYIIGAIVGDRIMRNGPWDEVMFDGELTAMVFQLMKVSDHLVANLTENDTMQQLNVALIYFFQSFRKAYIGQQSLPASKIYETLGERLALDTHLKALDVIVSKIFTNLRIWINDSELIEKTLGLLHDLTSGQSIVKLLLKLDSTTFILNNHTSEHFRFLEEPQNFRLRTKYYSSLCRLLFNSDEVVFDSFMGQFVPVLTFLSQQETPQAFQQEQVKRCLIGLGRDLCGLVAATATKKHYARFFHWLYPTYTPILVRAAEVWHREPSVTTPLLKFYSEFCFNKQTRLSFECNSEHPVIGILVFKEVSKALCAYASHLPDLQLSADKIYEQKYKGLWISIQTLVRTMMGSYVNFGVFELYDDSCFVNVLMVVLNAALSVPISDMMAYTKLSKNFFQLLDLIFRFHLTILLGFSTSLLYRLTECLREGLKSIDQSVPPQCASAIDALVTFYYNNATKNTSAAQAINRFAAEYPQIFPQLLHDLLNIFLFEECHNQWSLSRPFLPLILVNEQVFVELKEQIAKTPGNPEMYTKIMQHWTTLMDQVERNLLPKNRDKFTSNVNYWRHDTRKCLGR